MSEKNFTSLDKPQYNSTLRLMKKLDELDAKKIQLSLRDDQIERINEKASSKLNLRGTIFDGLVSVEPDREDFLKYLEIKQRRRVKPQISHFKNSQKAPDLMEFYPDDLIKEFQEVDIEQNKPSKLTTQKASTYLLNDPISNYFKWN